MKREIKFRGKCEHGGQWVYGNLVEHEDWVEICGLNIYPGKSKSWGRESVDPLTVGQYTGIKDINGKEIYEGDIIRDAWDIDEVVWDTETAGLYLKSDGGYYGTFMDIEIDGHIEVIGNIFDNKELLKGRRVWK